MGAVKTPAIVVRSLSLFSDLVRRRRRILCFTRDYGYAIWLTTNYNHNGHIDQSWQSLGTNSKGGITVSKLLPSNSSNRHIKVCEDRRFWRDSCSSYRGF